MSEGPFRMPRSADRSVTNQPEPAPEPPKPEPTAKEEPKRVHRGSESHRPMKVEKSKKPLILSIIAAVVAVVVIVGIWALVSKLSSGGSLIDSSKYQAVFFTNGQVYFGKLHKVDDEYMKLTEVFYLQTQSTEPESTDSKNPQKTATDQSSAPTLIKLGEEIHGPQDEMVISKDQVLFYENLKSDGKVSQSIEKYKNPN